MTEVCINRMGRRKFSFKMYVYLIKETNKRHMSVMIVNIATVCDHSSVTLVGKRFVVIGRPVRPRISHLIARETGN